MVEPETASLDRLDTIIDLLRQILRRLDGEQTGDAVKRDPELRGRILWREYDEQVFAAVIAAMVEVGLVERVLLTAELIAAAASSTVLHAALVAAAPPSGATAEPIDARRLGRFLTRHETDCACGWRLTIDYRNHKKPRWLLVAEGV
jgi:hypothetical protein